MLITAALVSLFSLYIDEYVAPVSNRMSRDQVRAASGSKYVVGTDRIWLLEGRRIIHIRNVEDRGNMLMEPTVLVIDEENPSYLQQRTDARTAQWVKGSWLAENSITRYFDGPEVKRTEKVFESTLPISITPEEFYRVRRKPEEMTRNELIRYVQNLRLANLPFSWYEVRIYRKSAGAALSVLFTILAIPVGFMVPVRGGLPLGIGLSVILATVFWTLFSLTLSLGYTGLLAAAAAAWSVNVVFFVAGIFTLFLLKHPRLI
jgi:lipopolysaccharide export LptBFGC system permease protein LptF